MIARLRPNPDYALVWPLDKMALGLDNSYAGNIRVLPLI